MRKLKAEEVIFTTTIETESIPIKGNAMASGDNKADREAEEAIQAQLDAGNPWAWCVVTVTADWDGHKATGMLGACSYESEEQFMGDMYEELKTQALDNLNDMLAKVEEQIRKLL